MFYAASGFKEWITERVANRLNSDVSNIVVSFDAGDSLEIDVRQYYMTDLSNTRFNDFHFETLAAFEEWVNAND